MANKVIVTQETVEIPHILTPEVEVGQEVVEVGALFTVPPRIITTQEVIEIPHTLISEKVYVTHEVIEVAYAGPYMHRFGPRVQEVG